MTWWSEFPPGECTQVHPTLASTHLLQYILGLCRVFALKLSGKKSLEKREEWWELDVSCWDGVWVSWDSGLPRDGSFRQRSCPALLPVVSVSFHSFELLLFFRVPFSLFYLDCSVCFGMRHYPSSIWLGLIISNGRDSYTGLLWLQFCFISSLKKNISVAQLLNINCLDLQKMNHSFMCWCMGVLLLVPVF